ncbi:radical SAM protein [Vibrio alginolyticus]|uniref:radical SAM protein n=1 Tax=Vibrio alginolyticus TaxID=663 RepID=UPI002119BCE5|nr:radical SAM protein [Vibrio alginolyticus]MCQ9070505.1 radical SAM protein [Vibrio alginolyticus]
MYYDYVSWNIQTTNDCFLDCDYCMTAESNKMKVKAKPEAVKEALRASRGFLRANIVFIGGEPLMVGKKWFKEAYQHFHNASMQVTSRIYTNGHLLDDEWVDMFQKEKTQIVVSFDGLGNGAKGAKRGLDKIKQHAESITYVTMTLSMSNYKSLIDCYKQVSEAGVKRFALQFDIYANSEQMTLMGKEVCKLFKYIEENPKGARFATYHDAKALMTSKGKITSNEFEAPVLNVDYCVNAQGTITLGVPDCFDPEWQLGNIYELNHVNDLVFTDTMRKVNQDYVESLNLIGHLEKVNKLTHGGGFFFDKKGIMPMNRPNIPKLHAYREVLGYFGEV